MQDRIQRLVCSTKFISGFIYHLPPQSLEFSEVLKGEIFQFTYQKGHFKLLANPLLIVQISTNSSFYKLGLTRLLGTDCILQHVTCVQLVTHPVTHHTHFNSRLYR